MTSLSATLLENQPATLPPRQPPADLSRAVRALHDWQQSETSYRTTDKTGIQFHGPHELAQLRTVCCSERISAAQHHRPYNSYNERTACVEQSAYPILILILIPVKGPSR